MPNVVCYGTSKIKGDFIEPSGYYTGDTRTLPVQLQTLLGGGYTVYNKGWNSSQAFTSMDAGEGYYMPTFLSGLLNADTILLLEHGINDIGADRTKEVIWSKMQEQIAYAKSQSVKKIIIFTIDAAGPDRIPAGSAKDDERLAYNALIRVEAPKLGVRVCDVAADADFLTWIPFNTTTMTGKWSDDIHWSIEGSGDVAAMAKTEIDQFVRTDSSTLITVPISQGDIWYSNRNFAGDLPRVDAESNIFIVTDQAELNVTFFRIKSTPLDIGVEVNGIVKPPLVANTTGVEYTQTETIILGDVGVPKLVKLTNGAQTSNFGEGNALSSYVEYLYYPNNSTFDILPPVANNPVYLFADSIGVGGNSSNRESYGVVPILRRVYDLPTVCDGWGWRGLYNSFAVKPWGTAPLDATPDTAKINAQITKVGYFNPRAYVGEAISNDFGLANGPTMTEFAALLSAKYDALHAAYPSLPIYLINFLPRTDKPSSDKGGTLEQWRQIVRDYAVGKSSWLTIWEGEDIIDNYSLYMHADNLHLSQAGQDHLAEYIYTELTGITPPPNDTANAGSDKTITEPSNSVTLTGSASGAATWTQLAGPNTATIVSPNDPVTVVNGLIPGLYQFRLTCGAAYDDVNVTVNEYVEPDPSSPIYTYHYVAGVATPSSYSHPAMGDEFLSFLDWDTLTATGNTITDTLALQEAIDNITEAGYSRFLKLSGVFTIDQTINVIGKSQCLVFFDNATSGLQWDGAVNGTMIFDNGSHYCRLFCRGKLDGMGIARVIYEKQWDNTTVDGKAFDTDVEYHDMIFTNAQIAMAGGWSGYGFADIDYMRCRFSNITNACISVGNPNALDVRAYDCVFEDCNYTMSNEGGYGNFACYNSLFYRVNICFRISSTQNFQFTDNYFKDCGTIIYASTSDNGCPTMFKGNIVLDCTDTPIVWRNMGALWLVNNDFRNIAGITKAVEFLPSSGEVFDINNTYSDNITDILTLSGGAISRVIGRTILPIADMTYVEPTPLPFEPIIARQVYEVNDTMTRADIVAIIQQADTENRGNRPVVHFAYSNSYGWSTPIDIPAGCDIQFYFDYSVITTNNILFRIFGPSKVTFSDVKVIGLTTGQAFQIIDCDDINARAYLHNMELQWSYGNSLWLDQQSNIKTYVVNSGFPYGTGRAIKCDGTAPLFLCGIQGASDGDVHMELTNQANVLCSDNWYENTTSKTFCELSDGSQLALFQNRMATEYDVTVNFVGVNGPGAKLCVACSHIDQDIKVKGNSAGSKILVIGNLMGNDGTPADFIDDQSTVAPDYAVAYMNRKQQVGAVGAVPLVNQGVPSDQDILDMLATFIASVPPTRLTPNDDNSTDLRFKRVTTENCVSGLHFMNS